ncbi:MAG TPA: rubredoxin, partial [Puia sp.]|nr:rubredoxin [Puia sp.]
VSLCKEFYSLQSQRNPTDPGESVAYPLKDAGNSAEMLLECRFCLTQYHPAYGDPAAGVAAGTPIDRLDPGYVCPVCGAPRADLLPVEKMVPVSGQS